MSLEKEIKLGESRTLEFKQELPRESHKWLKTIVAFANGAGGRFVIGINDERQVVGLPAHADIFKLKDSIADAIAQACKPQIVFDIYQESVKDRVVLVVEVFPGNSTPYYLKKFGIENGTFIRLGATTRLADANTLFELDLKRKRRYYDELPCSDIKVQKKDMQLLCKDFSKRSGKRISNDFLFNTQLLRKEGRSIVATNAYSIFVGKKDFFGKIQCARFKGTERATFIDKKDFEGPLLEQVDGAYKFVLSYLKTNVKFEGLYRKESCELPENAIRELILNAVIHRNYMMSSCVQVAVYDNRVEISSPGALYGTLTLQEALSGRSSIRNKIIATVCEKLGIVEGWGTGIKRIIDTCKELKIRPPEFLEIGDLLRVNFYRVKTDVPNNVPNNDPNDDPNNDLINGPINDPLNLIDLIKANPSGSYDEYAKIRNVSSSTIKRHLQNLKDKGVIERQGANKNGYWLLLAQKRDDAHGNEEI